MEAQLNDALVSTASRAVRARKPCILVEYCCEDDSLLSHERAKAGGKAHRYGLPRRDLRPPQGVRKTMEHLGKRTVLWGRLPRGP